MVCTVPGMAARPAGAGDATPLGELRRMIEEDILAADIYRADVAAIAAELRSQLPPECRGLLGADEAGFAARIADLARLGVDDVLARLLATAGGE